MKRTKNPLIKKKSKEIYTFYSKKSYSSCQVQRQGTACLSRRHEGIKLWHSDTGVGSICPEFQLKKIQYFL